MKTPAGFECTYFYGDYYRGRHHEECRLVSDGPTPDAWKPELCRDCPVPAVGRANACENMLLRGRVQKTWFGLRRQIAVSAYCRRAGAPVAEPMVGCGQCHPLPPIFEKSAHDPHTPA